MTTVVEERWQTGIKSISEGVRHIFSSKEFSDVTFRVRGEPIQAHKLVLASRSAKFAGMLMSPNAPDEIIVDRASPVTVTGFKTLLGFMYTDELNTDDKKSIVEGYLSSKYYGQKAFQAKCIQEFESWELNVKEVCALLDIEWDITPLKEKCISFVQANGKEVIFSDAFVNSSIKAVSAILESGALKDVPVLERIECVVKWGKKHTEEAADYSLVRQKLLNTKPPLFRFLEFQNLSLQELPAIPKTYPKLLTDEEITKFLVYFSSRDRADLPSWCTHQQI